MCVECPHAHVGLNVVRALCVLLGKIETLIIPTVYTQRYVKIGDEGSVVTHMSVGYRIERVLPRHSTSATP